jgi:hypothetical protein
LPDAASRHAKIQSIRPAGDPNAPALPEHMTLDQLRESIIVDLERLPLGGTFARLVHLAYL